MFAAAPVYGLLGYLAWSLFSADIPQGVVGDLRILPALAILAGAASAGLAVPVRLGVHILWRIAQVVALFMLGTALFGLHIASTLAVTQLLAGALAAAVAAIVVNIALWSTQVRRWCSPQRPRNVASAQDVEAIAAAVAEPRTPVRVGTGAIAEPEAVENADEDAAVKAPPASEPAEAPADSRSSTAPEEVEEAGPDASTGKEENEESGEADTDAGKGDADAASEPADGMEADGADGVARGPGDERKAEGAEPESTAKADGTAEAGSGKE